MSKYRIYELAKEFKTDSKTVLNILRTNNITVKSHASTVGDDERKIVEKNIQAKSQPIKSQPIVEKKPIPAVKTSVEKKAPVAVVRNEQKTTVQKNSLPSDSNNHNNKTAVVKKQYHENHEKNQSYKDNNNIKSANTTQTQKHSGPVKKYNNEHKPNEHRPSEHRPSEHRPGEHRPPVPGHKPIEKPHKDQQAVQHNNQKNIVRNRNTATNNTTNTTDSDHRNSHKNAGHFKNKVDNTKPNQNNRHTAPGNASFNHNKNNKRNWRNSRNNRNHPVQQKQEIIRPKVIKVGENISVKELASKMTYTVTDVIKKLMMLGIMATINQEIDFDTAVLVAAEFNINVEELPPEVDLTEIPEYEDSARDLLPRPPVVTVMGHVDHGKTSLLDVIRKTSVTSSEAGGITQHIGAYQVMCKGKKIVFLDTPGHEAFTAMRARGAQVTDIAVLVVAADDGVMPQTLEAINHAKAAKVPIVVAINKIDKPGANPEHVKQQLSEHELIAEDWGGETIMVPVSAKQKMGINELLEMILLVAEMQELKANPNRDARGIIIEAQLDKGRGPVATVLVQNGTLHVGDSIIAGTAYGKVRAMINDRGEKVKKAGPSMPVEVLGLSDVPQAGDEMAALEEHLARTIAEKRIGKQRTELINNKKVSLDDLFQQINEGNIKDLNIILKADVQGSLEALKTSLLGLNKSDEVRVSIVHAGVGAVNESDVMLASAANALILAFNVRPDANARKLADTESIDIRTYRVIYEAINDIEAAMKGMLAPKYKEVIQGKVEIRQVMKFSKVLVAGSYVLEGKITNTSKIRIIRDNIVVHEGQIESLRRFKDDVKEVMAGYECGITLENYRDFKNGDIIEAYTMEEIAPQSL